MNTSSLSLRADRPRLRTQPGNAWQRIGAALEKLWSLSGRVSLPSAVFPAEVTRLPRGMVRSLEPSDGVRCLKLVSGTVWITGTPALEDTILHAGETYEFGDRWPYVIEALTEAKFMEAGRTCTQRPGVSVSDAI